MSIVTKTGDQGETGLYNGTRVKKSDPRMEALGDIDELSSQLGFLPTPEIQKLQRDLFELGALVGNPVSTGTMSGALAALEKKWKHWSPICPLCAILSCRAGMWTLLICTWHARFAVVQNAIFRCWIHCPWTPYPTSTVCPIIYSCWDAKPM